MMELSCSKSAGKTNLTQKDPITMKIKLLTPNAIVPTRGTKDSAGLDLYADL